MHFKVGFANGVYVAYKRKKSKVILDFFEKLEGKVTIYKDGEDGINSTVGGVEKGA